MEGSRVSILAPFRFTVLPLTRADVGEGAIALGLIAAAAATGGYHFALWPLSSLLVMAGALLTGLDWGEAKHRWLVAVIWLSTYLSVPLSLYSSHGDTEASLLFLATMFPLGILFFARVPSRIYYLLAGLLYVHATLIVAQPYIWGWDYAHYPIPHADGLVDQYNPAAGLLMLPAVWLMTTRYRWWALPLLVAIPYTASTWGLAAISIIAVALLWRRVISLRYAVATGAIVLLASLPVMPDLLVGLKLAQATPLQFTTAINDGNHVILHNGPGEDGLLVSVADSSGMAFTGQAVTYAAHEGEVWSAGTRARILEVSGTPHPSARLLLTFLDADHRNIGPSIVTGYDQVTDWLDWRIEGRMAPIGTRWAQVRIDVGGFEHGQAITAQFSQTQAAPGQTVSELPGEAVAAFENTDAPQVVSRIQPLGIAGALQQQAIATQGHLTLNVDQHNAHQMFRDQEGVTKEGAPWHVPWLMPSGLVYTWGLVTVPGRMGYEQGVGAALAWTALTALALFRRPRLSPLWWVMLGVVLLSAMDFYTWQPVMSGWYWLVTGQRLREARQ